MAFKDVRVVSPEYSLNLRLEDDTIRLDRSTLNFDRLNVYSTGKKPLVFDGTVNFSDFENILLDLRAHASSYELINAKRTQKSSAYGKVYVDVSAGISGTLSDMNIRGRLGVLGNTDVTYILKDSPLTVGRPFERSGDFCRFQRQYGDGCGAEGTADENQYGHAYQYRPGLPRCIVC